MFLMVAATATSRWLKGSLGYLKKHLRIYVYIYNKARCQNSSRSCLLGGEKLLSDLIQLSVCMEKRRRFQSHCANKEATPLWFSWESYRVRTEKEHWHLEPHPLGWPVLAETCCKIHQPNIIIIVSNSQFQESGIQEEWLILPFQVAPRNHSVILGWWVSWSGGHSSLCSHTWCCGRVWKTSAW